jgi:hypothetical protein
MPVQYPQATLSVDYPEKKLNRLTTFFRIFVAIPILIVMAAIVGGFNSHSSADMSNSADPVQSITVAAGFLVLPVILMLLFRRKYPKWWYDWNLELSKLHYRVSVFLLLMRDEYPSTDEEQNVHLDFAYPNALELNRWMPLVKWFLAIPHYFVLLFIGIGVFFATIGAWFAILFTGSYPKSIFNFVEGYLRWSLRVEVYACLLTTDKYPPFSLDA